MEFYKVIEKRKSIREFEKKRVPKDKLKRIIKAAAMAASAGNAQPWEFYVVQSKKKRDKISEILYSWLKKHDRLTQQIKDKKIKGILCKFYKNLGDAPCIIFVYGNYKGIKKPGFYLKQSVDLAAGNLMNAAVEEGLGTCWVGSLQTEEKEISKMLNVPSHCGLMASIIIGYPKKGYKPLIREKKKLKEVLFWR
jgi:nitroreductase